MNIKLLFSLSLVLSLAACSTSPHKNSFIKSSVGKLEILSTHDLYIQIPSDGNIKFQGHNGSDKANETDAAMLYPANSPAVFLAAVFTHAATADAINDSRITEKQKKANLILEPYKQHLQGFKYGELLSSVIQNMDKHYEFRIRNHADLVQPSGWVLKSEPIFFMTQNQRGIILKHAMYIHRANKPDEILHKNIIEIASREAESDDLEVYWIDENNLVRTGSELYEESIKLFIADMAGLLEKQQSGSQLTFRYALDGKKRYERGTLINNNCGQTTIRTLRGWIKSFPTTNSSSTTLNSECSSSAL